MLDDGDRAEMLPMTSHSWHLTFAYKISSLRLLQECRRRTFYALDASKKILTASALVFICRRSAEIDIRLFENCVAFMSCLYFNLTAYQI